MIEPCDPRHPFLVELELLDRFQELMGKHLETRMNIRPFISAAMVLVATLHTTSTVRGQLGVKTFRNSYIDFEIPAAWDSEQEGVAMLSTLFAQMGLKPTVKTSRNITPEDLQQHSVILLGSPFQNIAVGQLIASGDFSFQNPDARKEQWRAQIVNAHPSANESAAYGTERDPETQVLRRDYSLISVQPGVVAGRNIAVLGGLDTKGTEGATRFITSRAGVEALSAELAAKGIPLAGGKSGARAGMPWFQALVAVHLEKGDQVLSTELSAVHPLHLRRSPAPNAESASAPAGR